MAATSPEPSTSNISDSTAHAASTFNPIFQPSNNSKTPSFTLPSYKPFYTLQPNLTVRARQLDLWSSLITSYCAHNHIFQLSLSSPPADLFTNSSIPLSLRPADIRIVLEYMSQPTNGSRIEFIPATTKGHQSSACYVFWKTAGEWADLLYAWVEEIGQKGAVLTVYELREGDAVRNREWKDMDEGMLRKVLAVLVKRGKAQVFGQAGEGDGVKFF